ncbi:MAG: hypothetical protein A2719_04015 [Candidatus Ryanbacteria bacterium RIFCSPHIGHO2_01_FULL_45_22]|uniref:Phosphoribosyltransferase domain-containing protein n=1 Tax=Candidatus Ryanbacteria bacterium RIFCSPHIGHO2_01_FULL_45_22 TaxID=1802114 RepID=A0A1G2G2L8_9BACT|nr:MAG: hypothetical protein A2719_04015 [Candidatus Ryanbacteria bacterium RIFCSPHIGHO2_01_FULL_45_22]
MSERFNLLDVRPEHFAAGVLNPAGVILTWLKNEDAYWEYKGEPSPEQPHAELSGGGCSNGFIDMPAILKYPYICEILGRELGKLLIKRGVETDWVISSPYSALTLGHEVAKELNAVFGFPIKDPTDPKQKRMLWRGKPIPTESRVLQVEELITTASTADEVRKAVILNDGQGKLRWVYEIATLVHRPVKVSTFYSTFNGIVVVSLLEKEIQNYPNGTSCPYCAIGSKKLRPRANWAELTGA